MIAWFAELFDYRQSGERQFSFMQKRYKIVMHYGNEIKPFTDVINMQTSEQKN